MSKSLQISPDTETELYKLFKTDFTDHTPETEIQKWFKQDNHERTVRLKCGKDNLQEWGNAPVKRLKRQPNEEADLR